MSTNRLHPRVPVGEYTEKISTCTPATAFKSDCFDYIDIGAVDRMTKSVTGTSRTIGIEAPSRARQVVHSGDVLVSTVRPNLNAVARVEDHHHKAVASTGFCVLRPKAGVLNSRYLFHWVKSEGFVNDMVARATGANYPAVSDKTVKTALIPLPSMSEQERIADMLDKADALRRKDQKLLQKYDELARSIFYEMFGDPVENTKGLHVKPLGELISIAPVSVEPAMCSGVKYVGLEHIEKVTGRLLENEAAADELKSLKFRFSADSLLYGKLRPNLRKLAMPDFSGICSTDIYPIECKKQVDKSFIAQILRSDHFSAYATASTAGANLPRISKKAILDYVTIAPPYDAQLKFGAACGQIARSKELQGLTQSQQLFDTLLDRYFA